MYLLYILSVIFLKSRPSFALNFLNRLCVKSNIIKGIAGMGLGGRPPLESCPHTSCYEEICFTPLPPLTVREWLRGEMAIARGG